MICLFGNCTCLHLKFLISQTEVISLANSSNKQAFLAEYMAKVNTTVQYAEGDSDYKICTGACRSAQATPTGATADDTEYM